MDRSQESGPPFSYDPYLLPYRDNINRRKSRFRELIRRIEADEVSIARFATGWNTFGLLRTNAGWNFTEYLPNAVSVSLIGDFNGWDPNAHKLKPTGYGRWSISFPALSDLQHGQKYKLAITTQSGETIHRVPAWSQYVIQNQTTMLFDAVVYAPPEGVYPLTHPRPSSPKSLRIYEAHIGMSRSDPKVSTYNEFTSCVLPRIARLGYNAVQLMAIQEHAYYGSFGYHVTSFFAPSSRYGTPNDLRRLIDTAHALGIIVLMDIVHSHMSNNHMDGIACMDGSDHCYTHAGVRGRHELWDSALFDYDKHEVLRFLLSNCRYWIEEIGFDGFRFDGITSMLYHHHGIGTGFTGNYDEYFGDNSAVDLSACIYLMLANHLIHTILPSAITIAEDVSGMPLLCRPVHEGGIGFDYRLAMAIPDMWIKLLKESRDEDWNIGHIVHTLTNRRWNEKTIAYAESHDQAIVGDKTIAMWLMDAEMYTSMSKNSTSLVIDRGIALHKLIRLLSLSLGNNGYLTFMGNEFGHPEWVDFPRQGNQWSYQYCRRQWNLTDCGYLKYTFLERFDAAMIHLTDNTGLLDSSDGEYVFLKDEERKVISFDRNNLVFVFNFHHTNCLVDFPVPTRVTSKSLRVVLDSDEARFGGLGSRINHNCEMEINDGAVRVYLPPRCCMVMADYTKHTMGIIVWVSDTLNGRKIRWISDYQDIEYANWNSSTVSGNHIRFDAIEGVKLVIEGLRPFGVPVSSNGEFRREDAFEIYVSGEYEINDKGIIHRKM
jgi:1,4-alpha-glucan branching enzyme